MSCLSSLAPRASAFSSSSSIPAEHAGATVPSRDAPSAHDPQRKIKSKSELRDAAWLLNAAATRWAGADDKLRQRTRLLLEHACKLDDSPLTTARHVAELGDRLEGLPPALRRVAGQLAELRVQQAELNREPPNRAGGPFPPGRLTSALGTVTQGLLFARHKAKGTAKEAVQALRHAVDRLSPVVIQRAKAQAKVQAMASREAALAPVRDELAALDEDLDRAEMWADLLASMLATAGDRAHARGLMTHLAEARSALHGAGKAIASGHPSAASLKQAHAAVDQVRSKLNYFNMALKLAGHAVLDFKFPSRAWPPAPMPKAAVPPST